MNKNFNLQPDDYALITKELFILYKNDKNKLSEVTSQLHMFFRDTLENCSEFKIISEHTENQNFDDFPIVEMNDLKKYRYWPRGDSYSMQSVLFEHFKKKSIDISEDFAALACRNKNSELLGPMKGKYAVMYSKGLQTGVFVNTLRNDLISLYDYLVDRNVQSHFNDRLSFLLLNLTKNGLHDKVSSKICLSRLDSFLEKKRDYSDSNVSDILKMMENWDISHYPHIKHAVKFKDNFFIQEDLIAKTFHFDIAQMSRFFNIEKSQISASFNDITSYYTNETNQKISLLSNFFFVRKDDTITICPVFKEEKQRKLWNQHFESILDIAKAQNFGNINMKNIINKISLNTQLEHQLNNKLENKKKTKI